MQQSPEPAVAVHRNQNRAISYENGNSASLCCLVIRELDTPSHFTVIEKFQTYHMRFTDQSSTPWNHWSDTEKPLSMGPEEQSTTKCNSFPPTCPGVGAKEEGELIGGNTDNGGSHLSPSSSPVVTYWDTMPINITLEMILIKNTNLPPQTQTLTMLQGWLNAARGKQMTYSILSSECFLWCYKIQCAVT